MDDLDDRYTLAKRIPAMSGGCCIQTNYGEIELSPEEGQQVADLVARLIRQRITEVPNG